VRPYAWLVDETLSSGTREPGTWREVTSPSPTTDPGSSARMATTTGCSGPYREAKAPALPANRAATIPVSSASTTTTSQ